MIKSIRYVVVTEKYVGMLPRPSPFVVSVSEDPRVALKHARACKGSAAGDIKIFALPQNRRFSPGKLSPVFSIFKSYERFGSEGYRVPGDKGRWEEYSGSKTFKNLVA